MLPQLLPQFTLSLKHIMDIVPIFKELRICGIFSPICLFLRSKSLKRMSPISLNKLDPSRICGGWFASSSRAITAVYWAYAEPEHRPELGKRINGPVDVQGQ